MADLQAGVIQPRGIGLVGLVRDGRERGGDVDVRNGGPFQHGAAGKAGGREQAAVVGRHAGGGVSGPHHAHERPQPVPPLGGPAAEGRRREAGVLGKLARAVGPVRRGPDGQIAGGFGVQQEHEAEDQRQRGFLDLPELRPVAQVGALGFERRAETPRDVGQRVLDEPLLQPLAQRLAEVLRFRGPPGQPATVP